MTERGGSARSGLGGKPGQIARLALSLEGFGSSIDPCLTFAEEASGDKGQAADGSPSPCSTPGSPGLALSKSTGTHDVHRAFRTLRLNPRLVGGTVNYGDRWVGNHS